MKLPWRREDDPEATLSRQPSTDLPQVPGWYWVEWVPPDPLPDLVWINPAEGWWSYDGPEDDEPQLISDHAKPGSTTWLAR